MYPGCSIDALLCHHEDSHTVPLRNSVIRSNNITIDPIWVRQNDCDKYKWSSRIALNCVSVGLEILYLVTHMCNTEFSYLYLTEYIPLFYIFRKAIFQIYIWSYSISPALLCIVSCQAKLIDVPLNLNFPGMMFVRIRIHVIARVR